MVPESGSSTIPGIDQRSDDAVDGGELGKEEEEEDGNMLFSEMPKQF